MIAGRGVTADMRLVLSSTCDLNVSKFQRYREQNETTRVTLTLSIITVVNGTFFFLRGDARNFQ